VTEHQTISDFRT